MSGRGDGAAPARFALAWGAVLLLGALGLLAHFDQRMLCSDEAETALLGLNVLRYGVPVGDDGRNAITAGGGADWNGEGVYTWSPWIDEYLAAGAQGLLGRSTQAARLPFALLGLVTLLLFARLAWAAFRRQGPALTATFLLATSVPFLLHARQCRYYSVLLFGQVLILWGFLRVMQRRPRAGVLLMALGLTLQFYGNFVVVPGNALGLAAVALLLGRRERSLLWAVPATGLLFAALALPWVVFVGVGRQAARLSPENVPWALTYLLTQVHFHVLPLVVLLVPAAGWWFERRRPAGEGVAGRVASTRAGRIPAEGRALVLLAACVAVLHVAVLSFSPLLFFRYLIPHLIVMPLLAAAILDRWVGPAALRVACVLVLGLTNAVAVATGFPFPPGERIEYGRDRRELAAPWPAYMVSLARPYDSRFQRVVALLRARAGPDDRVYTVVPEMALIFATDLRCIDARRQRLDPRDLPEWILTRSPTEGGAGPTMGLTDFVRSRYDPIVLDVPATPGGARRPDPNMHEFFQTEQREEYVVLHRRDATRRD